MLAWLPPSPILADNVGEIISTAIPIILVAIWTINTLLSGRNQQQNRTLNRPRPDPTSRRLPNRPPGERATLDLSPSANRPAQRELDRFLEEVSGRRRAAQGEAVPGGGGPALKRPPLANRRPGPVEPVQVIRPTRPAPAPRTISSPPVVAPSPPAPLGSEISRQVENYMKGTAELGTEIDQHVRQQLNHQVGTLRPVSSEATEIATGGAKRSAANAIAADQIRALLASPQNLRRAFVLTEVFNRPFGQRRRGR